MTNAKPIARSGKTKKNSGGSSREVERVQTGVRIEKRVLSVLKALADSKDMSLGDLIEGIALHAFEGKQPFARATLDQIAALKKVFGLQLSAADSHLLVEARAPRRKSEA
jgi:hypothetical protein